jgi:AcrR family transcriptional regulator
MTTATRLAPGEPRDQDAVRKTAIAQAAASVFLRYGFRKTSVDDVARAAKLSRQGIYLHFPNKEALFRAAVELLADQTLAAERAALARPAPSLEERLLGAFEAMSVTALGACDPANVQELFSAAVELARDVVGKLDEQIVTELAAVLAKERTGRRRSSEIGTRALAENLYVTSYGLKQRGHLGEDYLARLRTAIRIVCKSLDR